jgi:hypothetical protein
MLYSFKVLRYHKILAPVTKTLFVSTSNRVEDPDPMGSVRIILSDPNLEFSPPIPDQDRDSTRIFYPHPNKMLFSKNSCENPFVLIKYCIMYRHYIYLGECKNVPKDDEQLVSNDLLLVQFRICLFSMIGT